MTSLLKVPKIGDILKFTDNYEYQSNKAVKLDAWGVSMVEIEPGTLARVNRVHYKPIDYDEIDCILYLSWEYNNKTLCFQFNYTIHQDRVEILPDTAATEILYGKN